MKAFYMKLKFRDRNITTKEYIVKVSLSGKNEV